jgi:cyanobactin maturation PatA/PatG family protease
MSAGQPSNPPSHRTENRQPVGEVASQSPPPMASGVVPSTDGIQPSSCGCGGSASGSLVYVIGEIGFDYGTEARRDSIVSHIVAAGLGASHPQEEERLARYLDNNPWDAASVIWTISINKVPIYAVKPNGPYAPDAYKKLVEFLDDNHKKSAKRQCNHVAIPGRIVGRVALLRTGHVVPVIEPEIRGMANWDTAELVSAALKNTGDKKDRKDKDLEKSLTKILEKIYQEHQSLGIRPQDRAINYAASNTTEITKMIKDAAENKGGTMFFDNIEFEPSEICRPGSECWIIKINFFVHDQTDRSRRMYRFTVDVSDTVPVSLADMQDWFVR